MRRACWLGLGKWGCHGHGDQPHQFTAVSGEPDFTLGWAWLGTPAAGRPLWVRKPEMVKAGGRRAGADGAYLAEERVSECGRGLGSSWAHGWWDTELRRPRDENALTRGRLPAFGFPSK